MSTTLGTFPNHAAGLRLGAELGLVVAAVAFALGVHKPFSALSFGVAGFVVGGLLQEFYRGGKARRQNKNESWPAAIWQLFRRNQRRYGGYTVHFGVILIMVAIIGANAYQVEAQAKGTLAGQAARIELTAKLRAAPQEASATKDSAPMQADASASIAPWAAQPLLTAQADLQGVDLAVLSPQAPTTLLSGHVTAGPTPEGWDVEATLTNARPAPWDKKGLPVDAIAAHAHFDGMQWSTEDARVDIGKGTLAGQRFESL